MESLLSHLPRLVGRKKKRVGRGAGSGQGAKSGRGTTRHQKARGKIPLHFEGGQAKMIKKYPLLRGKGKNKSVKQKVVVISLESLNKFRVNETVNLETLTKQGILKFPKKTVRVKIVANGKIEKKLTVDLPVSQKAREKIEKAGGKVKN